MSEEAIYSLRKQDLRACFLSLLQYARDPTPLAAPQLSLPPASLPPRPLPALLALPLEIRQQIYQHLLTPPSKNPIKGPHPRQLQAPLSLSQSFPPSILRVNKQIYAEAVPIFYGSPPQTVYITINYQVWAHKTQRSPLILSSLLVSSLRNLNVLIQLGSEKRSAAARIGDEEAEARVGEVKKGLRKLGKWLINSGAEVEGLVVGWQEPQQRFEWEVKKGILDGLRAVGAKRVEVGVVNWGVVWNRGRKYRFEGSYLKTLERGWVDGAEKEMQGGV